jgi:TolA-binding protein
MNDEEHKPSNTLQTITEETVANRNYLIHELEEKIRLLAARVEELEEENMSFRLQAEEMILRIGNVLEVEPLSYTSSGSGGSGRTCMGSVEDVFTQEEGVRNPLFAPEEGPFKTIIERLKEKVSRDD